MKRIITALILIPIVLWIVFAAPIWVTALCCGLVALLAQEEYLNIIEKFELFPLRKTMRLLVLLLFMFYADNAEPWRFQKLDLRLLTVMEIILLAVLAFPLLMIIGMKINNINKAFPSVGLSWLSLIYISIPLVLLTYIRTDQSGSFWVAFIFFTVWAGDIAAMYVGKSIGKHKLAPRISPGKTWEGTLGSIIGSLLTANIWFYFVENQQITIEPPNLSEWITFLGFDQGIFIYKFSEHVQHIYNSSSVFVITCAALLTNIASQFGDLAESMLKRGVDIKDSGNSLPGHGGMLDRIDALLFAVPVVFLFTLK